MLPSVIGYRTTFPTDPSYLDEVEIDYEPCSLDGIKHGTKLVIMNLHVRKQWQEDDFEELHDRLSRLISPFSNRSGQNEISDFTIDLSVPGYPSLTGTIEPHELTRHPKYKLSGKLNENGAFTGDMSVDGEHHHTYKSIPLGDKGEKVNCGQFEIEIRAWDRDREGLEPYMLQFNEKMAGIRRILNRYCGVSIYRDGFRVHPYGESGNDWLSLDTRSRQTPTLRLANNQVIAAIRISRSDNPELKDRTTREGLVHNNEYDSLRDWFVRIIALLEEERYRIRPREEDDSGEVSSLFEAFDMSDVVEITNTQLGKQHPVAKLVRDKDVEIRSGVKKLQEHYSRVMMAAGFGQLVDIVVHEIGAPLGRANRELVRLERSLRKALGDVRFEPLQDKFTSIKGWLEQISNRRDMLIPKTAGRRGRATSFSIQEEILGNLSLFESLLAKQNIKVSLRAPEDPVVVHMSRSAVGQIVANLIDNTIYWLTRHHGDGKGGNIDIHLKRIDDGFTIVMSDDGPGVLPEDRDRIFDMNFTRKPNGMGLGLFIARQVIDNYGRLIYRDDGELSGACFEALFERKTGL